MTVLGEFLDLQSLRNLFVLLKGEVERCLRRIEVGHASIGLELVASPAKESLLSRSPSRLGRSHVFCLVVRVSSFWNLGSCVSEPNALSHSQPRNTGELGLSSSQPGEP